MFGAKTIEYSLKSDDGWAIDLDDIERKMDSDVRLLVFINPNNPTGNVANSDEVDQLLDIAKKWPNCMIVADEIYDGLDFYGEHVSVASRSKRSRYFLLMEFQKCTMRQVGGLDTWQFMIQ